jgi:hypothetical protein
MKPTDKQTELIDSIINELESWKTKDIHSLLFEEQIGSDLPDLKFGFREDLQDDLFSLLTTVRQNS